MHSARSGKKPFSFVAVRHSRSTLEFMEKYDSFTLAAFPAGAAADLNLIGETDLKLGDQGSGEAEVALQL